MHVCGWRAPRKIFDCIRTMYALSLELCMYSLDTILQSHKSIKKQYLTCIRGYVFLSVDTWNWVEEPWGLWGFGLLLEFGPCCSHHFFLLITFPIFPLVLHRAWMRCLAPHRVASRLLTTGSSGLGAASDLRALCLDSHSRRPSQHGPPPPYWRPQWAGRRSGVRPFEP